MREFDLGRAVPRTEDDHLLRGRGRYTDDIVPPRQTSNEVPAKTNPLGIKGAGEAGTVGALPAVMNAINDALALLGIRHFDMPATPERLWRVVSTAKIRPPLPLWEREGPVRSTGG